MNEISVADDTYVDNLVTNKQMMERRFPNAVLPLLRYQPYESSESSSRYQPEDRNFRSDLDEGEVEEASFSGQEYSSDHSDILEWTKARNALMADEETTALSVWVVACPCGSLRLENVRL
ncbi:hypothetical protein U1Q18_051378, partial [Sarracenia purpurea var. burkii]